MTNDDYKDRNDNKDKDRKGITKSYNDITKGYNENGIELGNRFR